MLSFDHVTDFGILNFSGFVVSLPHYIFVPSWKPQLADT